MKIIIILTLLLSIQNLAFARESNRGHHRINPGFHRPPAAYPINSNTPSNPSYTRNTGSTTIPYYLQNTYNPTHPYYNQGGGYPNGFNKEERAREERFRGNRGKEGYGRAEGRGRRESNKEDFIPVYNYNEINYFSPQEAKEPETNREKAFKSHRYEAFGEKR